MPDNPADTSTPVIPKPQAAPVKQAPLAQPNRTGAAGGTMAPPMVPYDPSVKPPTAKPAGPPVSRPPATPPPKPLTGQQPASRVPLPATAAARPLANQTMARQTLASFGMAPGARADLLYGESGTTKTSRLGDIAEYLFKRYGKRSRLITADTGGWEVIEDLVRTDDNPDGIIDAFALVQHRTNLYETMQKLCLGFWPEDPRDPQSRLLPPTQNGLKEFSGVFYEGLTSWCDIAMNTNVTDLEHVRVPRSEAEKENLIESGEFKRRFSSQTDYGSIQEFIAACVRDSGMLPMAKVVWTALEQKGEDDQKKPVLGPDIIGRKATGKCGPWFGNLIHIDLVPVNVEVPDPINPAKKIVVAKPKPIMFLRSHIDPLDPFKLSWPAKTRALRKFWDSVPDFMEPDMGKFYEMMDAIVAKGIAARRAGANPHLSA